MLVLTRAIPAYIAAAAKQAGPNLTIEEFQKIVEASVEFSCPPEDREKYHYIAMEAANNWLTSNAILGERHTFMRLAYRLLAISGRPRSTQPLSRVARAFKLFVTRRHYENVIAPQIADVQHEYAEARRAGRAWEARLIIARGYASLIPKPLWLWLWALVTRAYDTIFRT